MTGVSGIRFNVLGPLEVVLPHGGTVREWRPKPATLLARLLLEPGRTIGIDALVHALWLDDPPASAVKVIQTYVSQLRRLLRSEPTGGRTGDILFTERAGYRLAVPAESVDAGRFETLVRSGHASLAIDSAEAERRFDEALRLWRGPPYDGFAGELFVLAEVRRLEELHLSVIEDRLEALLGLGRAPETVADLQDLTCRHPFREHAWALLMNALYQSGRQVEALAAYSTVRRSLGQEFGVEPGPELELVERRILRQELACPSMAPPRRASVVDSDIERRPVTVVSLECPEGAPIVAARAGVASTAERFGGLVLGTGRQLDVVFGAAAIHDDDAERAVRCALAVRRLAAAANAPVGIGVACEEADIDRRTPFVPSAVAARARQLASSASPNQVLAGPQISWATRRTFVFEPCADGTSVAARAFPPGIAPPTSATTFVGRQAEIQLLCGAWNLTVERHRPMLVTVSGPAGIGKTRLVDHFMDRLADGHVRILAGPCTPDADNPLGGLSHIVRTILGIGPVSPSVETEAHLVEWLAVALPGTQPHRRRHLVAALHAAMSGGTDVRGAVEPLRHLLEAVTRRRPAIVVLEDLHRADASTVELVELLFGRLRGIRLLLVAVARTELLDFHPAWPRVVGASLHLPLGPLGGDAAERIARAAGWTGDHDLPKRAGGNPLFIEELAAAERTGRTGLPLAIRGAVGEQLDTLPPLERHLLAEAAVLGRRFAVERLASSIGITDEMCEAGLDSLELRGLVRHCAPSTTPTEHAFEFAAPVVADVCVSMLPSGPRRL